jgi:hypothetical protein
MQGVNGLKSMSFKSPSPLVIIETKKEKKKKKKKKKKQTCEENVSKAVMCDVSLVISMKIPFREKKKPTKSRILFIISKSISY